MTEIVKIGRAAPVQQVITTLEDLLARARSGELRSLLFIGDAGGHSLHGGTEIENVLIHLGMLERLKHRLLIEMDEVSSYADAPEGET